jgi:sodium transport system permease protein
VKLSDVGIVAGKELRETLRDRRTLAVMLLFPLVVYPLMTLLMAQAVSSVKSQEEALSARIAFVGPASAVEPARLAVAADVKHFTIVPLTGVPLTAKDARAGVSSGAVDAVAELEPVAHAPTRVRLWYDESRDASRAARTRLTEALASRRPAGCDLLFAVTDESVTPRPSLSSTVLAQMLPIVVVFMILLGAFHPAIDITAGERERGTLETILSAPVNRLDLMTGKVIAVATLAAVTGLLNMISLALTTLEGEHLAGHGVSFAIPWARAAATMIVVVPAAFFFASLMVAVGAMARTHKEAQTLLTPVYVLSFSPMLVATLGNWKLAGPAAFLPPVNVTLLARDLILGKATVGNVLVVVASTIAFGALALSLAARLYDSERLLSADDGSLGLAAWVRRLLAFGPGRDATSSATAPAPAPAPTSPSPSQALMVFAVAFILFVSVSVPLQQWRLAPGILLSEWVGMLGLVAVFARGTGRRLTDVLRLRAVPARALAGAVLVGLSASTVLGLLAQWFFPPPADLVEQLRHMVASRDGIAGVAISLFLTALTPAVCEEALFRGPILRGFSAKLPRLMSAVITGALFGLFHLDLWRIIPTGLLGIALSLIALECDSIVPAVVAHFTNNALIVLLANAGADDATTTVSRPAQAAVFAGACLVLLAGGALLRNTAAPTATV